MEDHGTALTRVIANRVQNAIAHLPDGEVLSSGEAFVLIQDTVRKDAIESGGDLSDVQLDIYIRTTCQAAFLESRRLVAEQLRGMTLQDAVMAITDGVRRLMAEDSLEIVPKPTKTFSGYCDVYDPWNLMCNAIRVEKSVGDRDLLSHQDIKLINEIKKARQLLHFVIEKEVSIEDIDRIPFSGFINVPERAAQMSFERESDPV